MPATGQNPPVQPDGPNVCSYENRTKEHLAYIVGERSGWNSLDLLNRDWHAVAGASEAAINHLRRAVPFRLPEAYLSLLRVTNGGEGPLGRQPFYFQLDSAETVTNTTLNKTHEEFFAGFLMIGSNGAGEFIALDTRTSEPFPVVAIDMTNIDLNESVLPIAADFDSFLELVGIESPD